MTIRLWHDDIRPAPAGWEWARTNEEAIALLETGDVIECSLDHDLGLDHIDPASSAETICFAGPSPRGTGEDLVRHMLAHDLVPNRVRIHSWNPAGATCMAALLRDAKFDGKLSHVEVVLDPYRLGEA